MRRKIIRIDLEKCTGCGLCLPNCPEGALKIIDNKARLISDLFCDGLGACIGHCPEGAITVEEREAEPYDERRVMENIVPQGEAVIRAHLEHLAEHGEMEYLAEARGFLEERGMRVEVAEPLAALSEPRLPEVPLHAACPGARVMDFAHSGEPAGASKDPESGRTGASLEGQPSELRQWPVQLHLVPASAPYFRDCDLLLAADCVAYTVGDFHRDFLKGKRLAIACPKLDGNQELYQDKITALIDHGGVKSITVAIMEVPCCTGLLQLARQAAGRAERKVPLDWIRVSIQGKILEKGLVS